MAIPTLSFNEVPLPFTLPLPVAPCQRKDCKDVFCSLLLPLSIVSVVEMCFVMFIRLVIVRDGD